jgi:hypothetical protein
VRSVLFKRLTNFFASWRGVIRLNKISKSGIRVAFYAEGNVFKGFLAPVIKAFTTELNQEICYLTSDPNDTFLSDPPHNVSAVYIGWGSAMIFSFQTLKFDVLAMTMPDLNLFHIKRSFHPVHYIYLQHSLVSSHMVYRTGAFDHFDSILCSGPHQITEIHEWEKINNLPSKELYEHGYAPLEMIMAGFSGCPKKPAPIDKSCRVLVAPSWGAEGVIDRGAAPLIECLLGAGHHVTLRTHPQSMRTSFAKIELLKKAFARHPDFEFDNDTSMFDSLYEADVLVSDWSGIALEYAFGLERPVIFIDVPRKVNNSRYTEMENIPLEVTAREQLGVILSPDKLDMAADLVASLSKDQKRFAEQAWKLRRKHVFNLGKSAKIGADIIKKIAEKQKRS